MADIQLGGKFKKNSKGYRAVLASQEIAQACEDGARPYAGPGVRISQRFDGVRRKVHVYCNNPKTLHGVRTLPKMR